MKKDDKIREAFSPLLDDELHGEDREAIENELAQEAELLREIDDLRRVDALYKSLGTSQAPADFEDRLRQVMAAKASAQPANVVPMRRTWPLLAAAASILVVSAVVYRTLAPSSGDMEMAAEPVYEALRADDSAGPLTENDTALRREASESAESLVPEAADEMAGAGFDQETSMQPDGQDSVELDAMFGPAPPAEAHRQTGGAGLGGANGFGTTPTNREAGSADVAAAKPPAAAPMPELAAPAAPMRQSIQSETANQPRIQPSAPATTAAAAPPPPRGSMEDRDAPEAAEAKAKASETTGEFYDRAMDPQARRVREQILRAGELSFVFDGTQWVQTGYNGEPLTETLRGSAAWRQLPLPDDMRALVEEQTLNVIFQLGDTWYRATAPAED